MEKAEVRERLKALMASGAGEEALEAALWDGLRAYEGECFHTFRGMEFSYALKGGEIFFSRKQHSKSVTRSSVIAAFRKALEVQESDGCVAGPKKLGTFGASYLYPVFLGLEIITAKP